MSMFCSINVYASKITSQLNRKKLEYRREKNFTYQTIPVNVLTKIWRYEDYDP